MTPADPAAILATLLPDAKHVETHLSHVFVGERETFKLKKPVHLSFVDYSTIRRRYRGCHREIDANRHLAPALYLGVVPLTREGDGFAIDGPGEPIDWLVHMRTFPEGDRADIALAEERVSAEQVARLVDRLHASHAGTPRTCRPEWPDTLLGIVDEIAGELERAFPPADHRMITVWRLETEALVHRDREVLAQRGEAGLLTRCHGDLHTKNLCLWEGELLPYDALEFDPALVTIDPLYDIAFLVADLWHRGHWRHANAAINRYLALASDQDAILLTPAYCSLRCAIRAMAEASGGQVAAGRDYLRTAHAFLAISPAAPAVLVSGRSGVGKTTIARHLAPKLGSPPGALHVRSDVVRKRLHGLMPEEPLPEEAYTEEARHRVYATCLDIVKRLHGRWPVVLDVAMAGHEPADPAFLAAFDHKVWLTAGDKVLEERLAERAHDASDATAGVMRTQRKTPPAADFVVLESAGSPDAMAEELAELIGVDQAAPGGPPYYDEQHEF